MTTIEDQARELLSPVLRQCLRERTQAGVRKYGQRLDENDQPDRARIIHAVQEGLDMVQYLLWAGMSSYAYEVALLTNDLQGTFNLTADEIMAGGKH